MNKIQRLEAAHDLAVEKMVKINEIALRAPWNEPPEQFIERKMAAEDALFALRQAYGALSAEKVAKTNLWQSAAVTVVVAAVVVGILIKTGG